MTRHRFLTAGLATAAISSVFTFAASAAHADDDPRGCGQPAVPAVTRLVVVEPVYEEVPAVVHTEWLWERDTPIVELEFQRVVSPEKVEVDWQRVLAGPTEYRYSTLVIDQPAIPGTPGTPEIPGVPGRPAVPAVPEVGHWETYEVTPAVTGTEYEYEHKYSHKTRWESAGWSNGESWKKTGRTRTVTITPAVTAKRWVVDTPAVPGIPAVPAIPAIPGTPATPPVPAVTHTEYLWSTTDPGSPWTATGEERKGKPTIEKATTKGESPEGTGWEVIAKRVTPAELEYGWATILPDDATATGDSRVAGSDHEETTVLSALAPEGKGWTAIADSATTVVDSPASRVLVTPGSSYEEVVTPALPATEPCVEAPATDPGTAGGVGDVESDVAGVQGAGAAAPVAATVLPDTGGVAAWMAPAGLATVALGAVAIRRSRRTAAR